MKMEAKLRQALFKVLGTVMGLVAGFLIFEAVFQLAGTIKDAKPSLERVFHPQSTPHSYQPAPWYYKFPSASVAMHTVLAPFSEDPAHAARHNSHGFRTGEYTTAHPPGTFRVLVIGDSFTYGWGVGVEDTYPAVLAKLLAQKTAKGAKVEVINLGIAGSRPADNFVRLIAHGAALNPDLMVFQVQYNDLEYSSLCPYIDFFGEWFFDSTEKSGLVSWLKSKTKTGRTLLKRNEHNFTAGLQDSEYRRMMNSGSFEMKLFREVLAALAGWGKQARVPVMFAVFPMIDADPAGKNFRHYDPVSFGKSLTGQVYGKMMEEVASIGLPVCDMLTVYRKKAGDRYLAVSESDGHPNPLGHRMAAEAVLDVIATEVFPEGLPAPRPEGEGWREEEKLRVSATTGWKDYNSDLSRQLRFFEALSKIHPNDPWTRFELAFANESLGRDAESRRLYESLAELAPSCAMPWYHAGHKLPDSRREIYMKKALGVVPDYSWAIRELAGIYLRQNRQKEACLAYTLLARHPFFPDNFTMAVDKLKWMGCFKSDTVLPSHFQGLGDLAGPDGKMRYDYFAP